MMCLSGIGLFILHLNAPHLSSSDCLEPAEFDQSDATSLVLEATRGPTSPPASRSNRDPPALDLAELGVGHINHQGQARHPHTHLQLGTQEAIGEVEHELAPPSCLLPVHIHKLTSL